MSSNRRFNFGSALLILLIVTVGAFLLAPLDLLGASSNIVIFQTQALITFEKLLPYIFVAVLGGGVGLAELSSTFSDTPREAIATRWGQLLIWINALAAMLAFILVQIYAPKDLNPLILIIGVGVGFPAIIRTKFTLAKQFGGASDAGGLNVNIGWLYEQFQLLCKKQIDLELMTSRLERVEKMLATYSTPQLYTIARYTLKARATLTTEEAAARTEELKNIINDSEGGPQSTKMNLALLILELGGRSYVDRLIKEADKPAASGQSVTAALLSDTTADVSTEAVAKQLTQLPLPQLVGLAKDLLKAPEDQAYIDKTATPSATLSEVKLKAPIAYYVISKAGAQVALQALNARTNQLQ